MPAMAKAAASCKRYQLWHPRKFYRTFWGALSFAVKRPILAGDFTGTTDDDIENRGIRTFLGDVNDIR